MNAISQDYKLNLPIKVRPRVRRLTPKNIIKSNLTFSDAKYEIEKKTKELLQLHRDEISKN